MTMDNSHVVNVPTSPPSSDLSPVSPYRPPSSPPSSSPSRHSSRPPPVSAYPSSNSEINSCESSDSPKRLWHVSMGPCRWNLCICQDGNADANPSDADVSCVCGHRMLDHEDYESQASQPLVRVKSARICQPPDVVTPLIERTELIQEIFRRLDYFPVVRISGTPASGKSILMNLMIRHMFKEFGKDALIYVFHGWDAAEVRDAGGWDGYFKETTGVNGLNWSSHPGYLFFDEAQESYPNHGLWSALFKFLTVSSNCRVLLFTSYGSPNTGSHLVPTPMSFEPGQQISLNPDPTLPPEFKPVGLLMDQRETMKLVEVFTRSCMPSIFTGVTQEFKIGVWQTTKGHAGLITSFCEMLKRSESLASHRMGYLDWWMVTDLIFSDPVRLFERIKGTRFSRGLPPQRELQDHKVARILKEAILSPNGLFQLSYGKNSEETKALEYVWRHGWLHAQNTQNHGIQYIFPSEVHKWYCSCAFMPAFGRTPSVSYTSPLELVKVVLKQFDPQQLSEPQRRLHGNSTPKEDQYGKEFYRCLGEVLDSRTLVSPEFTISHMSQSGSIDFFILDLKVGIELLRDNDRITEHLNRFESEGTYYPLLQSHNNLQWIVLNCTSKRPERKRPESLGHLYHAVFTSNYRTVEILRSDLELELSFPLLENRSHVCL